MSPTSTNTTLEVVYDADCSADQLAEVLSHLDRWSQRTRHHVMHQRAKERFPFSGKALIEICGSKALAMPLGCHVFLVQSRNLSQTGLCFVTPSTFLPRVLSDETPLMRAELVFSRNTEVLVRLPANADQSLLVHGVVQRQRQVNTGYFEFAIRFLGRGPSFASTAISPQPEIVP